MSFYIDTREKSMGTTVAKAKQSIENGYLFQNATAFWKLREPFRMLAFSLAGASNAPEIVSFLADADELLLLSLALVASNRLANVGVLCSFFSPSGFLRVTVGETLELALVLSNSCLIFESFAVLSSGDMGTVSPAGLAARVGTGDFGWFAFAWLLAVGCSRRRMSGLVSFRLGTLLTSVLLV